MKRNTLFTKIAALMLCVMMVIGCLPVSALALDWEGAIDVVEPEAVAMSVLGDGEADGNNALTVEPGFSKYVYTWTAIGKGTLSITMPEYLSWTYTLSSSNEAVEDVTGDTEAEANAYPSIEVVADDEITLTVIAYSGSETLSRNITASFEYAAGTENNPISIFAPWEETHTIAAGSTVYFKAETFQVLWAGKLNIASSAAFTVVVDGVTYESVENAVSAAITINNMTGAVPSFNITNNGEADIDCTISFEVPVGTQDNRAQLELGDHTIAVSADGYYAVYNATEEGTLTITMTSDNWYYCLNNVTSYIYGDSHNSGEETVVSSYDIAVNAGDEVQIDLGTADYTAADVSFTLSFEGVPAPANVAKIGDVEYLTVAEALNAASSGDTVTMIADSDESDATLIIKPGVTLYLATYELKAGYLIGLNGSFIYGDRFVDANNDCVADSDHASLVVAQDNVSLSSGSVWYKEAENRKYIPVWYNGAYVFTQARFNNVSYTKTEDDNGYVTIKFWAQFPDLRKNILKDSEGLGIEDNDLSVIATVGYVTADGVKVTTEYFYTAALINDYVLNNYNLTCGMGNCEAYTNLTFSLSIISDTGVVISTATQNYTDIA